MVLEHISKESPKGQNILSQNGESVYSWISGESEFEHYYIRKQPAVKKLGMYPLYMTGKKNMISMIVSTVHDNTKKCISGSHYAISRGISEDQTRV